MSKRSSYTGYDLRHPMILQTFTVSGTDSRGQQTGSWGSDVSVRCSLQPLSSRTAEYAHQLYELATHTIVMRHRSSVTSTKRLKYGSRIFAVGHVQDIDERGRWLKLTCSEEPS